MLVKRYGSSIESVETNFDSKALTEIGFRRDRLFSLPTEELERDYERVEEHALEAKADGPVHDETEQAMLDDLERQLEALLASGGEDDLFLIESESGVDYPKTRSDQKNVIVQGENRLYFYVTMSPPLRIGHYRPKE